MNIAARATCAPGWGSAHGSEWMPKHGRVYIIGRQAGITAKEADLVEGLGHTGVGAKVPGLGRVDVEEGEVDIGRLAHLVIERFDMPFDAGAVQVRIIKVEVEIAQENKVLIVGPPGLFNPAHNPFHHGVEFLAAVVQEIAIVEVGVDGHDIIGGGAMVADQTKSDTVGLPDKG
jgi:hypothetical protein